MPKIKLTFFNVLVFVGLALIAITAIYKYGFNSYSEKVDITIRNSGENSDQIIQTLEYFEKDSLKYKAAEFLIENMPYHYTKRYEGEEIINQIFRIISDREKIEKYEGNYDFPETNVIWDSLSAIKNINPNRYKIVFDQTTITARHLIENIEWAFRAWQLPWAKNLTFYEFCEYILPYRFDDEELESWRPIVWKQFGWMVDSLKSKNVTDPVVACDYINTNIKSWFRFNKVFDKYPKAIKATHLLQAKMGKCQDQAGIANFIMRTLGVPVVHESVPQWGNRSMGHDFSAVRKLDGSFIDFLGGEHNTGDNYFVDIPPKVYRHTFAVQQDHPFFKVDEKIAPKLFNPIYKDVTGNYLITETVAIPKNKLYNVRDQLIYLCVFDNSEWIPVDIGVDNGKEIVFKNIGRNIVYLPTHYIENESFPIGPPIIVSDSSEFIEFDENELETLTLKRKYPITRLKKMWMAWMRGGVFEGANTADFSNSSKLYTIIDSVEMYTHTSKISNSKRFQYLRYSFPDSSFGSLGEITFLGCNGDTLAGEMIKSDKVSASDWDIAFDSKLDKFIHTPLRNDYNNEWIGIKLNEPKRVCEIKYTPRTDRNNIELGDMYNLQYWKNIWISVEIKKASKENEIVFDNVPKGALLRLSNLTKGKEERIFLYNNGVHWY